MAQAKLPSEFPADPTQQSNEIERIRVVEQHTGSLLPTSVVSSLAASDLTDRELIKYAKQVARRSSIPLQTFFRPLGQMRAEGDSRHPLLWDDVRQTPVSWDDAMRLFKPYKREAIKAFFPELEADPKRVAAVLKALGPVRAGNTDFPPLLLAAADIAKSSANLYLLRDNIKVAAQAEGLYAGKGVSALQVLLIAKKATDAGVRFTSVEDMMVFFSPELGPQIEKQREARKRMEQDPSYQMVRQYGDPSSPDYMPNSDAARQWAALEDRGPLYASALFGGDVALSNILSAIVNDERDYVAYGQELVERQKQDLENKGMEGLRDPANAELIWKSWGLLTPVVLLGWTVGWGSLAVSKALQAFDWFWQRTAGPLERIIGNPQVGVPGTWRATSSPDDPEVAGEAILDAKEIVLGRTTVMKELEEEGVSPALYIAFDIVFSFLARPEILIGKALRGAKYARFLLESRAGGWLNRAESVYSLPVKRLGNMTIPEAFVRAALETEDAELKITRLNARLRKIWQVDGAHPALVQTIFSYSREAAAAGRSVEQITEDVRELFLLAHGFQPKNTSLADRVYRDLVGARQRAGSELERAVYEPLVQQNLNDRVQRAVDVLNDFEPWVAAGGILDPVLPKVAGPLTGLGRGFREMGIWDTQIGRRFRALAVAAPRRSANMFSILIDDPELPRSFSAVMKRSRLYSYDEIARIELEVSQFMNPTMNLRELKFQKYVEKFNKDLMARVGKEIGASPAQIDDIIAVIQRRVGRSGPSWGTLGERLGETFSATAGPSGMPGQLVVDTNPVFYSQLRNEYQILDPLLLRQGLNEAMGRFRQARNTIYHTIGKEIPELRQGLLGFGSEDITGNTVARAMNQMFKFFVRDLFLATWKPLAVIRPAYILRVVGIEEQSRFLATRGILERLRAGKLSSRLMHNTEMAFGSPGKVLPVTREGATVDEIARLFKNPPGIRVTEVSPGQFEVFLPSALAGRLGEAAYADANALTAVALAGQSGPLRDKALRSAAGKISFAPLARPDLKAFQAVARGARVAGGKVREMRKAVDEYLAAWHYTLTYHIAMDPIGNRILQNIAKGMSHDDSILAIEREIVADRRAGGAMWNAITGVTHNVDPSVAEIQAALTRMFEVAEEYTLANPVLLAKHALGEGLSVDVLRTMIANPQFPLEQLPVYLYGPELDFVFARAAGTRVSRGVNWIGQWILQRPTNAFSRRPYARSWEKQFRDASYALAKEQGRSLTPELIKAIDKRAEEFAKSQVQRIMFDYTKQARLGDALDWVFPFLGPFQEQFQVWSRIVKQNPAVVTYIPTLFRAAKESGFIREDEYGQLVVPLSGWLGFGPWLDMAYGMPGWQLIGPLSNANQFFQNSLPLRINGGTIPLVGPGVSPLIQMLLQSFFDSDLGKKVDPDVHGAIASYALSYGRLSPGSLFPPYLRNFLSGLTAVFLGEAFGQEDTVNRYKTTFNRLYQMKGITPLTLLNDKDLARELNDGKPFRTKEEVEAFLDAKITEDVGTFFIWRAFMNMLSPMAPSVISPAASWEKELRDIREDPKFADDYEAQVDEFLKRHPDGIAFLVSKLTPAAEQSGALQPVYPNKYVNMFLDSAGAQEFAERYPGFVWALIPHELREGESDVQSIFEAIGRGLLVSRTLEDTNDLAAVRAGWREYNMYEAAFQGWLDAHPLSQEGDADYEAAKTQLLDVPAENLRARNPWWGANFDTFTKQRINRNVMQLARALAADPDYQELELGQYLREFIPEFDAIRDIMRAEAISSLDTVGARMLGLPDRWEALMQLREESEDFDRFVSLYNVDKWLSSGVKSDIDLYYEKLQPVQLAEIEDDNRLLNELEVAIDDAKLPGDKSIAYENKRLAVNDMYGRYPEDRTPLHLAWNDMSPAEQLRQLEYWSQLPVKWLDRFQKEQLGLASDDETEQLWSDYNRYIAELDQKTDQGIFTPQQRSAMVATANELLVSAERSGKYPLLAEQIKAANTWGYLFFKTHPGLLAENNPASHQWALLAEASYDIMKFAYATGMYGADDWDPAQREQYNRFVKMLNDYITNELIGDNQGGEVFKEQWDHYQDAYGGFMELRAVFLPEYTRPFGSGAYLTDWP